MASEARCMDGTIGGEEAKVIIGLIPARGGSKGVPRKNIRQVAGKPLIAYTIECAKKCTLIDHVVVSTDDNEIADISKKLGAEIPFIRPRELALDTTPTLPVMQHAVEVLEDIYEESVELVVLLEPTGPLKTVRYVEGAIKMQKESECDAVVSGNIAKKNPYFEYLGG